jgi:hypothetical protein
LQAAVKSRNIHLVKVLANLIKKDACARFTEKEEKDLLIQAFRSPGTTVFTTLLEDGIPIPTDTYLGELLSEISKAGDVQAIRYLSARGANISSCSGEALYIAITRGLNDVVQVLIDLGITLEGYISFRDEHPLVTASKIGQTGIVRILIASGTYTTTPDGMGESLLNACTCGHDSVVRVLLDCGVPVDLVSPQQGTPLVQACRSGHLHVVQMLLENGADVNLGGGSRTPIAAACEYGELSVVKALVKSGADPNPILETTPLSLAFYSFTISTVPGLNSWTPAKIDKTFARLLLSRSANPNVRCSVPGRSMGPNIAHTEQSGAILARTLMYGAAIMDNA